MLATPLLTGVQRQSSYTTYMFTVEKNRRKCVLFAAAQAVDAGSQVANMMARQTHQ